MWVYRTSPKKVEKVQVYHHFARILLSVFFVGGFAVKESPTISTTIWGTIFSVVHFCRLLGYPRVGRVGVTFRAAGAMRFPWGHASGPLMLQHLNLYHLADAWTEHVALLKWLNWIWGSYLYMVKLFRMVNDCIWSRFVSHKDFGIRGMVTINLFEDSEPSNTFN